MNLLLSIILFSITKRSNSVKGFILSICKSFQNAYLSDASDANAFFSIDKPFFG